MEKLFNKKYNLKIKAMKFDSFIKGPLTSLLGLTLMCFAFYGWWIEGWTNWEAGGVGMIGFALLWMRDRIPSYMEGFVDGLFAKFGIEKKVKEKIEEAKKDSQDDPPSNPPLPIILLLAASLALPFDSFAQSTDTQLTTQSNVIRNETSAGGNTKTRIADMFQALINSKENRIPVGVLAGTDNYTLAAGSYVTSYVTNRWFVVQAANANTGAGTLNVNSLGVKVIARNNGDALEAGDLEAGGYYIFVYNGVGFRVISLVDGAGGGGGATAAGSTGNVQYKSDGGGLQAEAAFSYDSATNILSAEYVYIATEIYDATGWNGDFTVPTKDAVRDKIESLVSGHIVEEEGTPVTQRTNINFTGAGVVVTDAGGKTVVAVSGGGGGATAAGSTGNVQYKSAGGGLQAEAAFSYDSATNILDADVVTVDDEAYDATGWNADLSVPTKNSVRDKIETLSVAGAQDLFITAPAMWPRITGGCSSIQQTELATSLFNIQSLDFDQALQEYAQFQVVLPRNWNNGTITVTVYWTAAGGSGTVQWDVNGGAYSNDDALTVAFGTVVEIDDTLITSNDLHITSTSSAITLAGTPTDADFLALQISRDPSEDTLSSDAKLLGVRVTLTLDASTSE